MSQVSSNISKIVKETSRRDPEYTLLWQQTKEALLKKEKSKFEINHDNMLTFKNKM